MKNIQIEKKLFLKNFFVLLFLFLGAGMLLVGFIYYSLLKTLEQEILGMNEQTTYELGNRLEDVLDSCNNISANIVIDDNTQLYFTVEQPEYFVKNYYSTLGAKLECYEIPYVDSVLLYAPKYKRIIDGSVGINYTFNHSMPSAYKEEYKWMKGLWETKEFEQIVLTRAKGNRWPYYMTIARKWVYQEDVGFVFINIDMQKLYNYLIQNSDDTLQFYVVDEEDRVIMRRGKNELYMDIDKVDGLSPFRTKDTYGFLGKQGEERYTYVQKYSEKYGFTYITVNPVNDYFVQIKEMQQQCIFIAMLTIIVAILVACIYSIKIIKPEQANRQLKQEMEKDRAIFKDTQLVALQTQLKPHFLFNTLNIASLMVEDECGDENPVVDILNGLSEILRYSLSNREMVTVHDEIDCVENYIQIMQYRYGDFETSIEVEESIKDYFMPKFVLQPLVENALQHGLPIRLNNGDAKITIQAKEILHTYAHGKELSSVCIDIMDNGLGIDEERLQQLRSELTKREEIARQHIGLYNVVRQFNLIFHDEQEITIDSTFGQGTSIRLIFPVLTEIQTKEE